MNLEAPKPVKRLYRSKTDRMIAGVCGGIAEYFAIDPIWIRLGFILLLLSGLTALLYPLMWVLVPKAP